MERLTALIIDDEKHGRESKRIMVPTMEGFHVIKIASIVRIAGSANYSTFYLDNGNRIMASKNLKYYEDLLPARMFFRSHQSHLVNLWHIKKISVREGYMIELEEGSSIPLAKRRKGDLMTILKGI